MNDATLKKREATTGLTGPRKRGRLSVIVKGPHQRKNNRKKMKADFGFASDSPLPRNNDKKIVPSRLATKRGLDKSTLSSTSAEDDGERKTEKFIDQEDADGTTNFVDANQFAVVEQGHNRRRPALRAHVEGLEAQEPPLPPRKRGRPARLTPPRSQNGATGALAVSKPDTSLAVTRHLTRCCKNRTSTIRATTTAFPDITNPTLPLRTTRLRTRMRAPNNPNANDSEAETREAVEVIDDNESALPLASSPPPRHRAEKREHIHFDNPDELPVHTKQSHITRVPVRACAAPPPIRAAAKRANSAFRSAGLA